MQLLILDKDLGCPTGLLKSAPIVASIWAFIISGVMLVSGCAPTAQPVYAPYEIVNQGGENVSMEIEP